MRRTTIAAAAVVCAVGVAVGCGRNAQAPASPSALPQEGSEAAADGVSLKATAPTPQSPINNAKPNTPNVVLVIGNATLKYTSGLPLQYRFEVYDASGNRVHQSSAVSAGNGTTSYEIPIFLEADKPYRWQARAEYSGMTGPWSAQATFIAPQTGGYIRGNELYDPLINGKTVGLTVGPTTFTPQGIMLNELESHVEYELGETLIEGEFSILVTNMPANTKGGKTKLFSMAQGYSDIITNDRRFTIEKRGDPPGIIAWRVITHDDQIDTEGPERAYYNFLGDQTYFWEATWRDNYFNLLIKEGGVNGNVIYDYGKGWDGRPYDPNPHVVYLGAPIGRSGADGASVKGAVIRQVWVSSRPRPAFANQ